MQSLHIPYFFCTSTIGLPQGEELGRMCPFCNNSWIFYLISSFSIMEWRYVGPLGRGAQWVRLIECLTWQCKGTPVGEEKMSLYYSTIISTCFYFLEEPFPGAMDVATNFPLIWKWIRKKINFPSWEMTLLHFFADIKEMAVEMAPFGILCNLVPK